MHCPDLVFRAALAADATAIAELHAESWRRHYRGAYSDSFLDGDVATERAQVWSERLDVEDGTTATILAEDGAGLVGFVHVVFDEDPEWGSLVDNLHVTFTGKRRGIGTQLMARGARAVDARGTGGLYLWVLEQNTPAQAFYASLYGIRADKRLVRPPGGVPDRLNGSPAGLRYAWPDPAVLAAIGSDGRHPQEAAIWRSDCG